MTLRRLVLAAGLIAVVGWAYATSFRGVFVYDDRVAIVDNPNIRALWPLTSALSAPRESPVSARPVASLSLAINYALAPADARTVMAPARPGDPAGTTERFLRNVWGYHLMNLLLHLAAALALAGIVRRTLETSRLKPVFGPHATVLAFVSATLWAIHPLTTDAVTYIAQRTELLMGLFYALTLYCAIRARETTPGRARWWITAAVLACAAGMGAKQTMVTAPVTVWIWDRIFLDDRSNRRARLSLHIGLAATWIFLGALVAYERWPSSIGLGLEGWTPWTYLLTQSTVIAHYARLAVLGSPLALDYDGWPMSRSVVTVLPFALPLALALAATIVGVIRRRAWAFPAVVWFATLAPSSSILPLATEIVALRRMYLPLAAFVTGVVVLTYVVGHRVLAAYPVRTPALRSVGSLLAGIAVASAVFTYGSMTRTRNTDFWSEERIWLDTVRKRPGNPRAWLNYGAALAEAGRSAEAETPLREAVRLKSTATGHLSLGSVLCATGRMQECVEQLERAIALDAGDTTAFHNLGEAYGALGNRRLAAKYFARAVDAAPDDPFLLNRLGWLLATSPEDEIRDGEKAVRLAERAIALTGRRDATSLDTAAAAYAEVGRFDQAGALAREALAVAGKDAGSSELTPELQTRLALYQARQKYREK